MGVHNCQQFNASEIVDLLCARNDHARRKSACTTTFSNYRSSHILCIGLRINRGQLLICFHRGSVFFIARLKCNPPFALVPHLYLLVCLSVCSLSASQCLFPVCSLSASHSLFPVCLFASQCLFPVSQCLFPVSQCLFPVCLSVSVLCLPLSVCSLSASQCLFPVCLSVPCLPLSVCSLSASQCLFSCLPLSVCSLSLSVCSLSASQCLFPVSQCLFPVCSLSASQCLFLTHSLSLFTVTILAANTGFLVPRASSCSLVLPSPLLSSFLILFFFPSWGFVFDLLFFSPASFAAESSLTSH